MRKVLFVLCVLGIIAEISFGQNVFPNAGNAGVGTLNPTSKLNVFGVIGNGSFSPQEDLLHVGGNELGNLGGFAGIRIGVQPIIVTIIISGL